ncbi:MAG: redoxin domain-containing protein, partial [Prolixibacteraceae bacterium]|nr:redoxin domain-containing protein [Prolixibacteraceae bacterium]
SSICNAQKLKIEVELPKGAGQNVILAHYYAKQILINDTISLDENGKGIFKNDTLLPQGLYKIFLNNENHFDFLLSEDQQFTIKNSDFSNSNIKIKGAVESEEFVNYMNFLSGQQQKRRDIEAKFADASEEEKLGYQEEIEQLTKELQKWWKDKSLEFPGTWLASFLMANYVPVPENIPEDIQNNDSLKLRFEFDFQKQHFWDYFDVTDERFLTTPLLPPKLETYFTKVLFQVYDSVSVGVLDLIEKSRPNKSMFRYITSYFLNESINSKIMGMDALFVDIAKKYYFSGEAFWADSTTLSKIRENVIFAEHNLIGQTAPELLLESTDGETFYSLHQINKKITIVLIYEPGCSHCQKFVPELYQKVYLPFRDKGLEVYAIYSMDNHKEWVDFINKNELFDWINVWDQYNNTGFKILYDARDTPGIYILDKNKKIIAKKTTVDQTKRIVELELNN